MSTSDHRVVDLTAIDIPSIRGGTRPDGSDLHVLRLALDLQLDAMLLTLGTAAHAESLESDSDGEVPWGRWLVEDLDLARSLAATLLEGETDPVPGLGGGFSNTSVESSLDNLVARYESMATLLSGVLDPPSTDQRWRAVAAEALRRCRTRLTEIHGHRRKAMAVDPEPEARAFIPGELLG